MNRRSRRRSDLTFTVGAVLGTNAGVIVGVLTDSTAWGLVAGIGLAVLVWGGPGAIQVIADELDELF